MYGFDNGNDGYPDVIDRGTIEQGSYDDDHSHEMGGLRVVGTIDDLANPPEEGDIVHADLPGVNPTDGIIRVGNVLYAGDLNDDRERGSLQAMRTKTARKAVAPRRPGPTAPMSGGRRRPILVMEGVNARILSSTIETDQRMPARAVEHSLLTLPLQLRGNGLPLTQVIAVPAAGGVAVNFDFPSPNIAALVAIEITAPALEALPERVINLSLVQTRFNNGTDATGGVTEDIRLDAQLQLGDPRVVSSLRIIGFKRMGNAFLPAYLLGGGGGGIQQTRLSLSGVEGATCRTTWGAVSDRFTQRLAAQLGIEVQEVFAGSGRF